MDIKEIKKIIDINKSISFNIVPKEASNGKVIFYCNKSSQLLIDDLELLTGAKIELIETDRESLTFFRDSFYRENKINMDIVLEELESYDTSSGESEGSIKEDSNSVIIKLLNGLMTYAIENNCSDIHLEGMENCFRVRVRKEGYMEEILRTKSQVRNYLISRIKIISNLDIAEKRVNQDGRFNYNYGDRNINVRVAITPTVQGEKAVLRILDNSAIDYTPKGIGLEGENLNQIFKLISQPSGLILNCGPTNSGKTSTIYAILKELNKADINIMTVEDPVEYKISGANQIQVNEKTGLDFERGLKTILRTDPDIIMIGEIRNRETAQTAIRASITGHLVFSTLHTGDSPSAIIRLMDMGVEDYLVAAGLIGVISQRLVRILCPKCKSPLINTDPILNSKCEIFEPVGCECCNSGYIKRQAIFEILVFNEEIKEAIRKGASTKAISEIAVKNGMSTLENEVKKLVISGHTSLGEAYKVIGTL